MDAPDAVDAGSGAASAATSASGTSASGIGDATPPTRPRRDRPWAAAAGAAAAADGGARARPSVDRKRRRTGRGRATARRRRPRRSGPRALRRSRTSTSRSSRASWWRSSVRPGRARRRRPTCVPRLYDVDDGAVEIDGHRRPRHPAREPGRRHRLRDPGDVPVPRLGPREPALRQARRHRRGARGGRTRWPPSTTGSWSCRRATTRSSASAATSSRAARSSASRSPGCCSRTRASSSSTRPRARSTRVSERLIQAAIERHDGGPHDARHRAPAVDHPARRPDPRLRARPHRGARHARASCSPGAASTRGCTTSSS